MQCVSSEPRHGSQTPVTVYPNPACCRTCERFLGHRIGLHFNQCANDGIIPVTDEDVFRIQMHKGRFRKDTIHKKSGVIWMSKQCVKRGQAKHAMSYREIHG